MAVISDIDEIVRRICSYCDNTSLAVLARSSKSLSEPALDELWKTLTSFVHLLKLFPDEIVGWRDTVYGLQSPVSVNPVESSSVFLKLAVHRL